MSEVYTMRTHPVLHGTTPTNSVNLGVTTHCSMKCPNCSIDVPGVKERREARHCKVSDLIRDSVRMEGLKRVHLSGGEPTLHPEFYLVYSAVKFLWEPQFMTIETNGAGYIKYRDLFPKFDLVFMTHYEKDAVYPGSPDNTHLVEMAEKDLGDKFVREPPVRHTRKHDLVTLDLKRMDLAYEQPCTKYYDPGLSSGYYNGKLYHCCVTVGIDQSLGIPVTANWREELVKQPMGCGACLYRGT